MSAPALATVVSVAVALLAQPSAPTQAQASAPQVPLTAPTTDRRPVAPTPASPPRTNYTGFGVTSVPPDVLARFRAAPLPATVTRRVQAMLDVRSPGPGLLSPDGKRLFFVWSVTGVRQIWRLDGPDTFPVQLTGGEDATTLFGVTRDGRSLVLQRDRKGEENPGLYLQPVDGGPLIAIQHKENVQTQAQLLSQDGQFLYFRANDVDPSTYVVYRHVFATKAIETVFGDAPDQRGIWSVVDRKAPKGASQDRLLLHKEVGGNQIEVFEFDEEKRTLSPLFGQGEHEDYEARYGAGDDILVLTPRFSEFRRLYTFSPATKTWTPITTDERWDVSSFTIDEPRARILVTRNEGGFLRPASYDAKSKKPAPLPSALPRGDSFSWASTTPDGRFTTFLVDPGVRPAESFVVDWRTGKVARWHRPSAPEVDLTTFVPVSLEEYPARDGTTIPMFVRRPPRCATQATPCPVIVDFHGGPESQTLAGFSTRAQLFVDAGFIVAQPNVRGSDGYGKSWIHADDGVKRKDVLTDIEDAALFVKKAWAKGGIPPKVGVMGGSYGGYATLMAMTAFAGAYDAGVEIVGISNLVTFLMNTAPYRRILRISEYGDPERDRETLLALSPTTHVDKIKGPLLLVQGATDPRVPVGEALQMFEVMQRKKLGAELILFPDEGHGVQKRENQVLWLGHALEFFEKHLKG